MLSLTTLLCSMLLGSMIFFVGVVLPSIQRILDDDHTLRLIRNISPQFYLWGIIVSALATGFSIAAKSNLFILSAIVFLAFVYSRQILLSKLLKARDDWLSDDTPEHKSRYKSLHKRSVLINIIQVVILTIIVVVTQIF